MDLGATITVTLFILLFVVPFIIIKRRSSKNDKQFQEALFKLAHDANRKIAHFDRWRNSAIGIDEQNEFIFFIREIKSDRTTKVVQLEKIARCRLVNTNRTAGEKNVRIIDRLELALSSHQKNEPELILEFYNSDYDSLVLSGELQLAEKWVKIINESLPKK